MENKCVCVYIFNFSWVKIDLMLGRAFILKANWRWGAGSTLSTSQSSERVKKYMQLSKNEGKLKKIKITNGLDAFKCIQSLVINMDLLFPHHNLEKYLASPQLQLTS